MTYSLRAVQRESNPPIFIVLNGWNDLNALNKAVRPRKHFIWPQQDPRRDARRNGVRLHFNEFIVRGKTSMDFTRTRPLGSPVSMALCSLCSRQAVRLGSRPAVSTSRTQKSKR